MRITRRELLALSGAAALAASARAIPRAADDPGRPSYKALVCIMLAGGNDAFNMLVPADAGSYTTYRRIRQALALPRQSLRILPGTDDWGRRFGLHPAMPQLQTLFAAGDAAFVAGTGTSSEPVSSVRLRSSRVTLPEGLFSHSRQSALWHAGRPAGLTGAGWGARLADLLDGSGRQPGRTSSVSLSGPNDFQAGAHGGAFSIENAAAKWPRMLNGLTPSFRGTQPELHHAGALADQSRFPAAQERALAQVLAEPYSLSTRFAATRLSQDLRQVATIIAARTRLGVGRQVFYVCCDGWDHHEGLLARQTEKLAELSRGLAEFRDALTELKAFGQVTTFTMSEFGRALAPNGSGCDHGWSGHQVIMGGAVRGGRVHGKYPWLSPDSAWHLGRGVYAPAVSTDAYFAQLALWMGLPICHLSRLMPGFAVLTAPPGHRGSLRLLDT